jgi:hypothetical protein
VPGSRGDSTRVRGFTNVPVTGASRVNLHPQAAIVRNFTKRTFSQWRAANITQTNEQERWQITILHDFIEPFSFLKNVAAACHC